MRKPAGGSIAELPVVVWVIFIALLFPLTDLATIALRSTTVFAAARNAARQAGRARTFVANGDNGELSAKNIAVQAAKDTNKNSLAGTEIDDGDVQVFVIGSPIKPTLPPIRQQTPLTGVGSGDYMYQIEARVTGRVYPLVTFTPDIFGHIEGISEPLKITAVFREYCEHPDGLNR
jgi:hypothetical protein